MKTEEEEEEEQRQLKEKDRRERKGESSSSSPSASSTSKDWDYIYVILGQLWTYIYKDNIVVLLIKDTLYNRRDQFIMKTFTDSTHPNNIE